MFHMRNTVGPRVQLARRRLDPRMTRASLRLQLDGWDISRSGVAKIEVGLRQVTDIEVVSLAKTLNVSAAWLLGEEGG